MQYKVDERAGAVISRAVEEARAMGCHDIGTEHLLLGFCHEDERDSESILAPVGITTDVVRAWVSEHGGHAGGAPDADRLAYTPAAGSVLRMACLEADGRRHESISAHHLLLGLIGQASNQAPQPGPDAARQTVPSSPHRPDALTALIRDREVDIVSLRLRVIARANSDGTGQGFPYLGAEFAAHNRLPGTRERWLRHGAVIVGYACLAALLIVTAPPGARAVAVIVAVVAPAGLFAVRHVLRLLACRYYRSVPGAETFETPGLRSALASAGLREVGGFCVPRGSVIGRSAGGSIRCGRRGVIRLRRDMKDPAKWDPDLTRIIAAHEAAHLARDDSMTQDLAGTGWACIAVIAVLTRPDTLWLLIPLIALLTAIRWHAELACDRMAVEVTGRIPATREVEYFSWAEQVIRRRRPLRRLGFWLRWLRTHPTWRMQRDAITRILAKEEHAAGSQNAAR